MCSLHSIPVCEFYEICIILEKYMSKPSRLSAIENSRIDEPSFM
jgi:hypothetical protein